MTIVGFNFKKISIERLLDKSGKININNNVTIKNVEEAKLNMGTSTQTGLRFQFEFLTTYEPELGKIELTGEVLYLGSKEVVETTIDKWKKEKKLPDALAGNVLNTILDKCNIEAVILSRDLGLPSPIPLPKITKSEDKPVTKTVQKTPSK